MRKSNTIRTSIRSVNSRAREVAQRDLSEVGKRARPDGADRAALGDAGPLRPAAGRIVCGSAS